MSACSPDLGPAFPEGRCWEVFMRALFNVFRGHSRRGDILQKAVAPVVVGVMPVAERLETRLHLTATCTKSVNALTVTGDSGVNAIVVSDNSGTVKIMDGAS